MSCFELVKNGVWPSLEYFFENTPKGSIVYWVTFSLGPSEQDLENIRDILLRKDAKLRVICRNPLVGKGPTVKITKSTYELIKKYAAIFDGSIKAFPRGEDEGMFDEDESVPGKLHAKFIVAAKGSEPSPLIVTGSFNFASKSLSENTESIFLAHDSDQAKKALDAALRLYECSEDLTEYHCEQGMRVDIQHIIDHGPRHGVNRPVVPIEQPTHIGEPEDLKKMAATLDKMLQNYPKNGQKRQYEIYLTLEKRASEGHRKIDLLYLPVGVGKTFIALRWLIYHLHNSICRKNDKRAIAVYLTPNEWIEKTIINAVADVAKRSGLSLQQASQLIKVVRPTNATEFVSNRHVSAVVADECQNWNPELQGQKGENTSYTRILNKWRSKKLPILGLSATPCRMKEQRFNPRTFIERFINKPPDAAEDRPFMELAEAIDEGFICRPEYQIFLYEKQAKVKEILTGNGNGCLIGYGEYSQVTLRNVWHEIADDPEKLAKTIIDAFVKYKTRRAVIFLPPVEDEADEFVEAMKNMMREKTGRKKYLFDFRSCSSSGRLGAYVFEQYQQSDNGSTGCPPVLLTIDRFGEGVSIKDIDMLVMLRATLSPRVAMQALGRGLRINPPQKERCVILDAVLFKERVEQWEKSLQEHKVTPKHVPENTADRIEVIGRRTIASIRNDNDEDVIHCITAYGYKESTVRRYIKDKHGQMLVRNAFPKMRDRRKNNITTGKVGRQKTRRMSGKAKEKRVKKKKNRGNPWTDRRIDTLKKLYKKGMSHAKIAAKMNMTDGQIHGKIRRLKEKGILK